MMEFSRIPGIAGFLGGRGASEPDIRTRFENLFAAGEAGTGEGTPGLLVTPYGAAGLLGRDPHRTAEQGGSASSDSYSILIEGDYFCSEGSRRDPSWLIGQIGAQGIGALDTLNGNYSLAVYDKRRDKVFIGGDRYSTRPLYYADVEGTLLFSNDFSTLLHLMPSGDYINYDAMLDFINFEFILCNETFHRLIKVLGHGERLEWDGRRPVSRRFWDYPAFTPSSPGAKVHDYVDGTFHLMRAAVKRRIEGKDSVGVTLSSGLDSRFIAACAADIRQEPLRCHHLETHGHPHTAWAAEICANLHGSFISTAFTDLDIVRLLDMTDRFLAGQFSINQAQILWLLASQDVHDTFIVDGQVQDTLLKPAFVSTGESSRARPSYYSDDVMKFHGPVPDDLLGIILKKEWADRAVSSRGRRIEEHLGGRKFDDRSALTQHYYYTTRGQRYVWGAPVLESSLVDVGFPGMDYELFDWAMSLPMELREPSARLYRQILCTFFPAVSSVPWDATGTPLDIYRGRVKQNYSLTGKALWIYMIRRATRGKVDLSRAFHDLDAIFRMNKEFRNAVGRRIEAQETLAESPISAAGAGRLAGMIMAGRNYFDLLQRVLTVINFFEHYTAAGSAPDDRTIG